MLLLWERLVRLHKVTKSAIPEEMICLAEKAKFSQHIINDEELALMSDALQRQIACLRQLSVWRRLWHKYILVLY